MKTINKILTTLAALGACTLAGAPAYATGHTEPEPEPSYVLVAWSMPSDDEAEQTDADGTKWPQELYKSVQLDEPSLSALDSTLSPCVDYQVDLYYDDDTTTALVNGGWLYRPGNPEESIAWGRLGDGVDPFKTVRGNPGDLACRPAQPAPEVTTKSEDSTDCDAATVTTTTTTTRVEYVWDDEGKAWVKSVPVVTTGTSTRAATEQECPAPVEPTPTPTPTTPVVPAPTPTPAPSTPGAPVEPVDDTEAQTLAQTGIDTVWVLTAAAMGVALTGLGVILTMKRRRA